MDTKKSLRKFSQTSGLLSLEASISLTFFLFLMLFMYSFFVIFEARNEVAHVLLSTADSLSLDAFANEALDDDKTIQGYVYKILGNAADSDGLYTENSKWYDAGEKEIQEVIEARFVAYLSGGNREEANRILESLNIVDGLDGLDFSESYVSGDKKLFLNVKYRIEYEFKVFGFKELALSQSCCSRLWTGQ